MIVKGLLFLYPFFACLPPNFAYVLIFVSKVFIPNPFTENQEPVCPSYQAQKIA
jgi:hypothetical protein